ncbi:MAG: DUF4349 domain-containing protein [Egibacteraceae bacterium]
MRRRLVALAVVALVGAACSASAGDVSGKVEARQADAAAEPSSGGLAARAGQGADQASRPEPSGPLPPLPAVPGDRIVKDGTMTVQVRADGFEAAFQAVVLQAQKLGGSVVSSSSRTLERGGRSGAVTVRVPVTSYEGLLADVGKVGKVRDRNVTSQDVTGEFIDLEARLRQLQAQEAFYLRLLGQAQGISDAIAVQGQLGGLQTQIEQVKGRLDLLRDRTSFSTLTVHIVEPGVPLPLTPEADGRPSLSRYWQSARDALVNVVGSAIVVLFFLLPLLLPAGALVLVWRLTRRRTASVEPSEEERAWPMAPSPRS